MSIFGGIFGGGSGNSGKDREVYDYSLISFATFGDLDDTAWETLGSSFSIMTATGQQIINEGTYPFTPETTIGDYTLLVRTIFNTAEDAYFEQLTIIRDNDIANNTLFTRTGESFSAMVASEWISLAVGEVFEFRDAQIATSQQTYYYGVHSSSRDSR